MLCKGSDTKREVERVIVACGFSHCGGMRERRESMSMSWCVGVGVGVLMQFALSHAPPS